MIVAVKGSKSSDRQWKLVDNESPSSESKTQRKLRVHRQEMVQYRLRKKQKNGALREEFQRLTMQMQQHVEKWRTHCAKPSYSEGTTVSGTGNSRVDMLQHQFEELVMEGEQLRDENAALKRAVGGRQKVQSVISTEANWLVVDPVDSVLSGDGWRVRFDDGVPSFHFHPFSREQCAATVKRYDEAFRGGISEFQEVGSLLGWRVERVPLVQHANGKWLVTRVKFTKQIHCAGVSSDTMNELDKKSWPALTTPELCPRVHRAATTSQTLQELDEDTVVVVSNTPQSSRLHVRYFNLIHRRRAGNDGRRTISYAMVIPDSAVNRRSREAERSREEVRWVCDGAAYMTLTQVDETTLEASYDVCSGCKDELQAQRLLIEWAHEAVRWEELVSASRLLAL